MPTPIWETHTDKTKKWKEILVYLKFMLAELKKDYGCIQYQEHHTRRAWKQNADLQETKFFFLEWQMSIISEVGCFLGCSAVQSGRSIPTFHRWLLLLISVKMEAASTSETLANFYQTARRKTQKTDIFKLKAG
jgi:hypothetical protein